MRQRQKEREGSRGTEREIQKERIRAIERDGDVERIRDGGTENKKEGRSRAGLGRER